MLLMLGNANRNLQRVDSTSGGLVLLNLLWWQGHAWLLLLSERLLVSSEGCWRGAHGRGWGTVAREAGVASLVHWGWARFTAGVRWMGPDSVLHLRWHLLLLLLKWLLD